MYRRKLFLAMGLLLMTATAQAGEIGFLEDFALSKDRNAALKQLIPGSQDYYYYHCLHYQQLEQWDNVDKTLKAWINRYKYNDRVYEILNRQRLLTYATSSDETLKWLRDRLNLRFNHQRELLNQKPNLPTRLKAALISEPTLRRLALARYPNTLRGFEDVALEGLADVRLSADQRRELISRLARPDYPELPQRVAADLNFKNSGPFGSFPVQGRLLLKQLDELLKLKPDLLDQQNFVNAYLSKLHPSDDVNWRQDKDALAAYLDRLWAFAQRLAPVHNSLKAHILYHRLVLDRSRGEYDAARFLEYAKLPRNASYMEPKYMAREENRRYPANLQSDYSSVTLLPTVGDDEPLVRSYLSHFFVKAKNYQAYEPYISDGYLRQNFAETKIVNNLGDPEQWYSLVTPAYYQSLKQRIDLDFAFTNKTEYAADEPVSLGLYVKNVPTLLVKVFEINTQNFYRDNLAEINTDINLDGLVANRELTFHYDDPPLRRVLRTFEFPTLKSQGAYVIDFIGNGISSRALIRKGKLQYLVRTGTAGQVFTILDEQNRRVNNATLWLAGTLYEPSKNGTITTPFSNQPGRQPMVLSLGEFSSLEHFQQEAEQFDLEAAIYVDREELLSRRKARFVIRPSLRLNGTPVSLKLLENVRLAITSHDLDGVATTKEVADFKLYEDRESVFEFQTPPRLATLQCELKAQAQSLSLNKKIDLGSSQIFSVNEIDRTDKIEDLHFLRVAGEYVIDVLGKSGESQPDRPVQVLLKHRDFRDMVSVSLQTDAGGRVTLGPLPDIVSVQATGPEGTSHTWAIAHDDHSYSQTVHAGTGQTVLIPYMGSAQRPERSELSLLELRGASFVADRFDAIELKDNFLQMANLAPGDFSLRFKTTGVQVTIRIAAGPRRDGYVLGDYRRLEEINPRPLQLDHVAATDQGVVLQLRNATPLARVHVFATRFEPAFPAYGVLARIASSEPYRMTAPGVESLYVAGRNIGDEYRYILDRKFKTKFPGNMLDRPSLLLNPWAVRSTATGEQLAAAGEAFARGGLSDKGGGGRAEPQSAAVAALADFADLGFLAETSLVLANLTADDNGVIEIKQDDLGAHQDLVVVAVDPWNTVSRRVSLKEPKPTYLDLRLAQILDVKQHFTQQKRISVVPAKETLVLEDISSAKLEVYDSLARVYGLYATLNPEPNLLEFGFLLGWPKLEFKAKCTLYSKYASHELNFFLSRKDPDFFHQVIQPYLANKKDKTFLDHYLLEHDLREYLKPWNFSQLNTVERILLGRRVAGERDSMRRFVREQWELLPPDPARFEHLFRTGLRGSALETTDRFDMLKSKLELGEQLKESRDEMPTLSSNRPVAAKPAGPNSEMDFAKKMPAFRSESESRKSEEKQSGRRKRAAGKDADRQLRAYDYERQADGIPPQYYRKLDKTQEWAENNYYHLLIERQNASLVTANSFWRDFAAQDPGQPFYSSNFAEASHNTTEMLLALAVIDLPFDAGEHKTTFDGSKMTFAAASPAIAFHEEIRPAKRVAKQAPILVSQNFFRASDRYRFVDNQRQDKFVTEEFLIDTVYGCQVVVTNPTSTPRKLDVLLQIPRGSLPVSNGQYTRSAQIDLQPYNTRTVEYYFYFPTAGEFAHYPVQVAGQEEVLGYAAPFEFHVVNEPANIDKQSWDYISQNGSNDDVINFLKQHNLLRVNLDRIAFRMSDPEFFRATVALLSARHVYNQTLWSYGVKHNDLPAIREFLQHADGFVAQCGMALVSPPLTIDPVARKTYEHLDYRPLVNPRVGQLGRARQILNDRFFEQYERLLRLASYRRTLDDGELMAVTYYMLLQDRVEEALGFFQRVNPEHLAARLQYDYFSAYIDFYRAQPERAHDIATKYLDHPIDRWRNAFANVAGQAEEIVKQEVKLIDTDNRTQVQTTLAAATPTFEFVVEAKRVRIHYQKLREVRVNYYQMDVELLFSRNPFVQRQSRQFSYIQPNASEIVKLPAKGRDFVFPLPEALHSANVLVEIIGAGQNKSQAYYANSFTVQTTENYGQTQVLESDTSRPLSKVYVKVYARLRDGSTRFYKDGYTDLRGRFDYTSLNTNELDMVDRFALLILSEDHGAAVREAAPPKR